MDAMDTRTLTSQPLAQTSASHEAAVARSAALRARVYANECRCLKNTAGCMNWLKVASEWELLACTLEYQAIRYEGQEAA